LTPILYPIVRKWKKVELWKYKHKTKEVARDKCIHLGIKNNNTSPKFVVLVEKTTLKDHNSYKNGLKNIELNNYGTYGNKGYS
jgi:hypothetical protein